MNSPELSRRHVGVQARAENELGDMAELPLKPRRRWECRGRSRRMHERGQSTPAGWESSVPAGRPRNCRPWRAASNCGASPNTSAVLSPMFRNEVIVSRSTALSHPTRICMATVSLGQAAAQMGQTSGRAAAQTDFEPRPNAARSSPSPCPVSYDSCRLLVVAKNQGRSRKRENRPPTPRLAVDATRIRELGFEPRMTEPKSVVLPLHHSRARRTANKPQVNSTLGGTRNPVAGSAANSLALVC